MSDTVKVYNPHTATWEDATPEDAEAVAAHEQAISDEPPPVEEDDGVYADGSTPAGKHGR